MKDPNLDSLGSRFNPSLASILSRGPLTMGSRPAPIKSASAPEPGATSNEIDGGKQLTHLTKGRARGPKRRSSTKHAEEVAEQKEEKPIEPLPAKKPEVRKDTDTVPQPQSSIWSRPILTKPKEQPKVTTSPDKLIEPTFSSTPEVFRSPSAREREKPASPSGSMKQRFAELSTLRSRNLFGSLLRSPSQPTKPPFPTMEIIPSTAPSKIHDKERLFVQAWSIVSRVRHVSLPNSEEHILYANDMHAFLYMFNDEPGASEPSAIKFLWVGRDCTLAEREGMEFVRLMGDQNADAQVIHQGHETPLFMRALGGVIVTREGTRRALDSVEDAVFCVRQCLGGISIDQVEFRKAEFCSGFSFVVKRDGDVLLWHGNGSLNEEIAAARRFAAECGVQVKEVLEGDPAGCAELWKSFEDREYASGDFWRRKYELNGFSPVLYMVEGLKVSYIYGKADCQARQMTLFSLEDVPQSAAAVVDGTFVLYVLIPPTASRSKADVGRVLQFAKVCGYHSTSR